MSGDAPAKNGDIALVAAASPAPSGAVMAVANGKEKDAAVVVYEEGTVGHLVQSEDLPAPHTAVAKNKAFACPLAVYFSLAYGVLGS